MTIMQPPTTAPAFDPQAAGDLPEQQKRQRFTLTRARDLDARLDAILMRARGAVSELEEVGIAAGQEHTHPVKQQLVQVHAALTQAVEVLEPHKPRTEQIVGLLEL